MVEKEVGNSYQPWYPSEPHPPPDSGDRGGADMVTVMLTLERPEHDTMRGFDRAQKYRALKSSASGIREGLVRWIKEHGLAEEVTQIGEPTAFNTLFVTSTAEAASQLAHAPGVLNVAPTGEFRVDLLSNSAALPEDVPDQEAAQPEEKDAADCLEECD